MALLLIGATACPGLVALMVARKLNRRARRSIFALTVLVIACSVAIVLHAAAIRGVTVAVLCMIGMELIGGGALLCLDRIAVEAEDLGRAENTPVSLPFRATLAFVLSAGAALLGTYHGGALETLDLQASQALQMITPRQFDPPFLIRKPSTRSCVLGAERPTFERDHIVDCYAPHHWQLLSRVEPAQQCPAGNLLSANVAVVVVAHDREYDRWCLARSSTDERLTSPVCPAGMPCTD